LFPKINQTTWQTPVEGNMISPNFTKSLWWHLNFKYQTKI